MLHQEVELFTRGLVSGGGTAGCSGMEGRVGKESIYGTGWLWRQFHVQSPTFVLLQQSTSPVLL